MNRNEWLCIGCLKIREERDFRKADTYGLRRFKTVEGWEPHQPLYYSLCSQCKTHQVGKIPNLVVDNIGRIMRYMPHLACPTAATGMLTVIFLYGGNFWAALDGGCSRAGLARLDGIWRNLEGYTVLGPNCYASWIRS